jgi:H3 lysine-79-specific histone-lysine N-methyltransferase
MKDEMMKNAKAFFEGTSLTTASTDQEEAKCESRSKFKSNNGVPVTLWKTVMDETYQRSVGPNIEDTKKYKSFSSETYGELNSM